MSSRRFGQASAETRTDLLDCAEQIMRDSGYAAVTSRGLARAAGLSPQILYYYFKTMDELFCALFQRSAEYYLNAIEQAKSSQFPILALWDISCDPSRAIFVQELMALANHRKVLMAQLSEFGRRYHACQTEIIEAEIAAAGRNPFGMPPSVVAAVMEQAARGFAFVEAYDMPEHRDARIYITERLKEIVRDQERGHKTRSVIR